MDFGFREDVINLTSKANEAELSLEYQERKYSELVKQKSVGENKEY